MQEPRVSLERIAAGNAECALDTLHDDYASELAQIASYAVNVVDTCREYRHSPEKGLARYLEIINERRGEK